MTSLTNLQNSKVCSHNGMILKILNELIKACLVFRDGTVDVASDILGKP